MAMLLQRRHLLGLAAACAWPAHANLPEVIAGAKPSVLPVGTFSATESPRFGFRGTGLLRRARVVATDRPRDLALLKMEGPPLAPLVLDTAASVSEGLSVALMGFPIGGTLGFAVVTHRGIIASITTAALPAATAQQLDPRALVRLREGNFDIYQLDATAYPGNSGGPVLDATTGRVVAIVNMVLIKAGRESALSQPTGISYAIPVRHLQELLRTTR
jgi:serine protease Do